MGDKETCNEIRKTDDKPVSVENHCVGCLCSKDVRKLNYFKFQCASLGEIFQMDAIWLCYLCKRIAQHAESFIQCVQGNQILLENYHGVLDDTIKSAQTHTQPLVNLNTMPSETIELLESDSHIYEDVYTVIPNCQHQEVKVKVELKEEMFLDDLEGEFMNDGDEYSDANVKEEDSFPLKAQLKEEIEDLDSIDLLSLSTQLKKSRRGKKTAKIKKESSNTQDREKKKILKNEKKKGRSSKDDELHVLTNAFIKTLYITREQCLEERQAMRQDKKYSGSPYKCEDCIKGFNLRSSFESHLLKHSESAGEYGCDICKMRVDTQDKLMAHMRYHFVRYQCKQCGLTRICRNTIKDHYTSIHCQAFPYVCDLCTKAFKRGVSLRKHKLSVHNKKERVSCPYCQKTYASKEVLRSHQLLMHTKEVTCRLTSKKYVCGECGMAFQCPSQLRNHGTKHSQRRDYYCVECDKSFKSDTILKTHLKTAAPHVNNRNLPFPCAHCDKRFSSRRNVEQHANRVHLNVRPYQCESCDKAYSSSWGLKNHQQIIHDGYKRPLRYPCDFCDKIFTRPQILKAHVRTHTGERPYQCDKCPASFNQSSILRTHERLIHLKQTRDGQPKHK